MKAIVDLDHSQRYLRAIVMHSSLGGPHVFLSGAQVLYMSSSLELRSSTGSHRDQLDDYASAAYASSIDGEVLAPSFAAR